METLYGVCAVLLTLAVVAVAVQAIITLRQLRETAEQVKYTAKAIELSALNVNDRVESTKKLFDTVNDVSNAVRTGWFKGAQLAFSIISAFKGGRK
ncbi:MAG: hypothetical protein GX410_00380 [Elusimicrobia bacterium]|nr:hypothetical protein [Elusimicrobiota bacterium]